MLRPPPLYPPTANRCHQLDIWNRPNVVHHHRWQIHCPALYDQLRCALAPNQPSKEINHEIHCNATTQLKSINNFFWLIPITLYAGHKMWRCEESSGPSVKINSKQFIVNVFSIKKNETFLLQQNVIYDRWRVDSYYDKIESPVCVSLRKCFNQIRRHTKISRRKICVENVCIQMIIQNTENPVESCAFALIVGVSCRTYLNFWRIEFHISDSL